MAVVSDGTTADSDDYSLSTATVTFGPADSSKTKNAVIALTDDDAVESAETIKLRIVPADNPANDLGDYYIRHADGGTATVTINSEDQASTNANLSALTATSSTSASGTFSTLPLTPSLFAAATTEYTATVGDTVTHVKLTPTKAHTAASIKVGKRGTTLATVASTEASAAIALAVGENLIDVEVTPESGADDKKTYTVTVTRKPSMMFDEYTYITEELETDPREIKVVLSGALTAPTTVTIDTGGGKAAETADFTLSTKTLTFAAGETEQTFTLSAVADWTEEGNEDADLTLVAVDDAPYALGIAAHDRGRDPGRFAAAGVRPRPTAPR